MDLYNSFVEDNNIIYSVDMIRLKTYLSYTTFSEIEFRFETCWKDFVEMKWTSSRMSNFFYNYQIVIDEGISFYFGFLHNNEKRSYNENNKYNFTIEFNPNKLKDNKIIMYLLSLSGEWYIKSYDLAMDLKISILDIIFDNSLKRRKDVKIFSNGYDNLTYEMGKGDGRIKIYNKKIESNLNILGDLTRVEVSRCLDDYPLNKIAFYKYDDIFPKLYLANYLYTFSDYKDKTVLALLYAVQHNYSINELTRSYKKKIESMLTGGYKIRFSKKAADDVIRKTIFYYFIKNDLVIFK